MFNTCRKGLGRLGTRLIINILPAGVPLVALVDAGRTCFEADPRCLARSAHSGPGRRGRTPSVAPPSVASSCPPGTGHRTCGNRVRSGHPGSSEDRECTVGFALLGCGTVSDCWGISDYWDILDCLDTSGCWGILGYLGILDCWEDTWGCLEEDDPHSLSWFEEQLLP